MKKSILRSTLTISSLITLTGLLSACSNTSSSSPAQTAAPAAVAAPAFVSALTAQQSAISTSGVTCVGQSVPGSYNAYVMQQQEDQSYSVIGCLYDVDVNSNMPMPADDVTLAVADNYQSDFAALPAQQALLNVQSAVQGLSSIRPDITKFFLATSQDNQGNIVTGDTSDLPIVALLNGTSVSLEVVFVAK